MKCRFRSEIECFEHINDCSECSLFNNSRLDDVGKKQVPMISNELCFCPFCLSMHSYKDFITGKRLLVCPDCRMRFLEMSLIIASSNNSIENYARWVYEYGKAFWFKVDFKTWNETMREYGIQRLFWDSYKHIKGGLRKMM